MDAFKRDNFLRLYPDRGFPAVEEISQQSTDAIRAKIAIRLGEVPSVTGRDLVRVIAEEGELLPGEDSNVGLHVVAILDGLGLEYSEYAYLNWGSFDALDRIEIRDLTECFGDIWYPDSDDLDIIDTECNWILSVRHDGAVSILRL